MSSQYQESGDATDNRFLTKALRGGCAARGSLSKGDAAFVCVQSLDRVPKTRFIFEVVKGEHGRVDGETILST
ncbi:hypothetical protein L6164_004221 [Bauhinia variegata]|uniref:Uncharacterized protein n=1 Tax=Bauhinia variegata TaxID=167791 RepID=A0ACB9Q3Z2_BAUVA|nr:hypothetical protein L6164_004221 [Bauhinia variegata]